MKDDLAIACGERVYHVGRGLAAVFEFALREQIEAQTVAVVAYTPGGEFHGGFSADSELAVHAGLSVPSGIVTATGGVDILTRDFSTLRVGDHLRLLQLENPMPVGGVMFSRDTGQDSLDVVYVVRLRVVLDGGVKVSIDASVSDVLLLRGRTIPAAQSAVASSRVCLCCSGEIIRSLKVRQTVIKENFLPAVRLLTGFPGHQGTIRASCLPPVIGTEFSRQLVSAFQAADMIFVRLMAAGHATGLGHAGNGFTQHGKPVQECFHRRAGTHLRMLLHVREVVRQ